MTEAAQKILVIKLGALGDFVQAMGAAAAIRAFHRDAEITLLTTRPYAEFARQAPYFEEIWIDDRPGWSNPIAVFRLVRRLRAGRFDRVYDLQTRLRTNLYFLAMREGRQLEWSGIAPGASHPHDNPRRTKMHRSFSLLRPKFPSQ